MTAQTLTEMRRLLERHGLKPRHAIGQHFLADPNLTRRVVNEAKIEAGDRVLEVGPGTGTLTRQLVAAGARVLAIEVDQSLRPVLAETLHDLPVDLRFADAAALDYNKVLGVGPWKVVANLPYQIGTQLILDWLRWVPVIVEMTVMVQLEVAQRLVARPDSRVYGLPSVVVGLYADGGLRFKVPPQVFYPPPQVASAVIRLVRKTAPAAAERAIELAAAGFGQRRKMLRGSLASVIEDPAAALATAGIDSTRRAENLTPIDFVRLAEVAP
ncbi:MAG: 16S rRNA (adenine(1518)-N(6)/adenine(1519)-N(6))-dimethyltransferase RsmA [Acidimicrobiia bacterium]